jgi:hypothetical protein
MILIKHYAMDWHGEVEVWLHMLLTSALYGVEWSALRCGNFNPKKLISRISSVEGWMDLRAVLNAAYV